MTNDVFQDVTPCGSCKNRRLGGRYRELGTTLTVLLLVTANVDLSSPILSIDAIGSSETSVFIRATRLNIPEEGLLYLNTISYM
jgi:hypothetical protein